jgi:uncharacterized protein (DUF983 family)
MLACPHCDYDVTRTLDDGLRTCPECGESVTEEACRDALRGPKARRVMRLYGLLAAIALLSVFVTPSPATWIPLIIALVLIVRGGAHARSIEGALDRLDPADEQFLRHVPIQSLGVLLYAVIFGIIGVVIETFLQLF